MRTVLKPPCFRGRTVEKAFLVGVVSRGDGCAYNNSPGIYARSSTYIPLHSSLLFFSVYVYTLKIGREKVTTRRKELRSSAAIEMLIILKLVLQVTRKVWMPRNIKHIVRHISRDRQYDKRLRTLARAQTFFLHENNWFIWIFRYLPSFNYISLTGGSYMPDRLSLKSGWKFRT